MTKNDPDRRPRAVPPGLPPHLAIRYIVFARTLGRDAAGAFARRALAAERGAGGVSALSPAPRVR